MFNRTKTIEFKTGTQYLGQQEDFQMPNGLFYKGDTGTGGTYFALTSNEPTIVLAPKKSIIFSKEGRFNNLFSLHSESGTTIDDIAPFLSSTAAQGLTPKFITTYDSSAKLVAELERLGVNLNQYRLLVDEVQDMVKIASYRPRALRCTIETAKLFNNVTYMTAQPVKNLEDLKYFKEMNITQVKLHSDLTNRKLYIANTNRPAVLATDLITDFFKNGRKLTYKCRETNEDKTADTLFVFYNSVREHSAIITKLGLDNTQIGSICADTAANREVLPEGFAPLRVNDELPPVVLITKTAFSGADFESDNGIIVTVSTIHKPFTVLGLESDLYQISGRIRTKTNPHRGTVLHITDTNYITEDNIKQYTEVYNKIKQEAADAKLTVEEANKSTFLANTLLAVLRDAENGHTKLSSLITYIDGKFVFNEFLALDRLDDARVTYKQYGTIADLKKAAIAVGFDVYVMNFTTKSKDANLIAPKRANFQENMIGYIEAVEKGNEEAIEIYNELDSSFAYFYDLLGPEKIKALKCRRLDIDKHVFLRRASTRKTFRGKLALRLKDNTFYTNKELKAILNNVAKGIGIEVKLKANDITDLFPESFEERQTIDGKRVRGYNVVLRVKEIKVNPLFKLTK